MGDNFHYAELVDDLRANFDAGLMKSLDSRLKQLHQINRMVEENEDDILAALHSDLRKSSVEGQICEVYGVYVEVRNCINNLAKWMKREVVAGDILNKANLCEIRKDPLGVVLIIGAWNYPFMLSLQPLIGALAAGNCVVLKPSEVATHTAAVLGKLISQYLSAECVRIINGGVQETTALLRCRFDHIFYTGGTAVGKIVMRAAAEHLTPVTLELGGKSPTIVDSTCDFDLVGQRIAWGKFLNCGQTCLAVDYVLCVGDCKDKLITALKKATVKFFGEDAKSSNSYGRIINKRHFTRVCNMIDESKVAFGNERDEDDLYISPTIMSDVLPDDTIMKDEIFGPVMPIMSVDSLDSAIEFIKRREKPLVIYVFSKNGKVIESVKNRTSSGGMVINDALIHFTVPSLPFGGVGHSGMGAYHGKYSFDCFTHKKSILQANQALESLNAVRYPPYDPNWKVMKYLRWIYLPSIKKGNSWWRMFLLFIFVLGFSVMIPYLKSTF